MFKEKFDLFNLQFFGEPGEDGDDGGDKNKKPDKTFTQEELDEIVKTRLERERKKYADYEDIKKLAEEGKALKEAQMTELEKMKASLEEIEKAKKIAETEASSLKRRQTISLLLSSEGLPLELVDRVHGEDEESIKADIASLKKFIMPSNKGGQGAPGGDPAKPEDYGAQYNKALQEGDARLAMILNKKLFEEAQKKKG
ncbi:capsid assembly scaffolding protein Gp46 family protein [Aminobacterium colombiense]